MKTWERRSPPGNADLPIGLLTDSANREIGVPGGAAFSVLRCQFYVALDAFGDEPYAFAPA